MAPRRRERARKYLDVAHGAASKLSEVADTWPPDWEELSLYAVSALENAVRAAAVLEDVEFEEAHAGLALTAQGLTEMHAYPAVAALMQDLVALKRTSNYSDELDPPQQWSPEDVLATVQEYIDFVAEDIPG